MAGRSAAAARRDVERFDRWAGTYDRSFLQRRVFEPVYEALAAALGASLDRGRVLDVGCGTGILTRTLASRAALALGVDPAPRMVTQARANPADLPASYVVAAAEALPLPDASFDAAAASLTLHHWRDARRGVAEVGRALRPGGRFVIADIDLPGPARWILRLFGNPHAGWSRRELADLLYRAGFTRVRAMTRGPLGPRVAIIAAER